MHDLHLVVGSGSCTQPCVPVDKVPRAGKPALV